MDVNTKSQGSCLQEGQKDFTGSLVEVDPGEGLFDSFDHSLEVELCLKRVDCLEGISDDVLDELDQLVLWYSPHDGVEKREVLCSKVRVEASNLVVKTCVQFLHEGLLKSLVASHSQEFWDHQLVPFGLVSHLL